jgi:spore coat protein U-like protein
MKMSTNNLYGKSRRHLLAALVSTAALSMSASVFAGQATTTMPVSIIITSGCSVSATPMVFPTPTALVPDASAIAQVNVICTNGTPFVIGLDAGAHSTDVAVRKMQGPALETLDYSIYQTGAHVTVWGNSQGVNTVASTGTGFIQQFAAYGYGTTPAVLPTAGTYTDTVNVFVYF